MIPTHSSLVISEVSADALVDYARIPSRVEVTGASQPYTKDYDAPPCISPDRWASHFDLTRWGILLGTINEVPVAGAAITLLSPDIALLWDVRVAPGYHRRGIGSEMFKQAEKWASDRGATGLKVETQDINVAAWEFYARQGCELVEVNHNAYPEFPDEVQLLWYKHLERARG